MEHPLPEDLDSEASRVRALVAWAKTTPSTLSIVAGLSQAHIGMFLRGEMKTLRRDTAEKVASVTGVTGAWITYGGPEPDHAHVCDTFRQACDARAPRRATPPTAGEVIVTPDATRNAASSPASPPADVPCPDDADVDTDPTGPVETVTCVYDNPFDAPASHHRAVV